MDPVVWGVESERTAKRLVGVRVNVFEHGHRFGGDVPAGELHIVVADTGLPDEYDRWPEPVRFVLNQIDEPKTSFP